MNKKEQAEYIAELRRKAEMAEKSLPKLKTPDEMAFAASELPWQQYQELVKEEKLTKALRRVEERNLQKLKQEIQLEEASIRYPNILRVGGPFDREVKKLLAENEAMTVLAACRLVAAEHPAWTLPDPPKQYSMEKEAENVEHAPIERSAENIIDGTSPGSSFRPNSIRPED